MLFRSQHEHDAKESKKNSALTRSISFSVCIYFTVALVCTRQPVRFKKIGICKPIYLFRLMYLPPFAISSLDLPWDPPLVYKPTKHATQFFLCPPCHPQKKPYLRAMESGACTLTRKTPSAHLLNISDRSFCIPFHP